MCGLAQLAVAGLDLDGTTDVHEPIHDDVAAHPGRPLINPRLFLMEIHAFLSCYCLQNLWVLVHVALLNISCSCSGLTRRWPIFVFFMWGPYWSTGSKQDVWIYTGALKAAGWGFR